MRDGENSAHHTKNNRGKDSVRCDFSASDPSPQNNCRAARLPWKAQLFILCAMEFRGRVGIVNMAPLNTAAPRDPG